MSTSPLQIVLVCGTERIDLTPFARPLSFYTYSTAGTYWRPPRRETIMTRKLRKLARHARPS